MRSVRLSQRLLALMELAKLRVFDMWLGAIVAVAFAMNQPESSASAVLSFILTVLTLVLAVALTCSLDDIVGLRDGVDARNHRGPARFGVRKPLLDGRLTITDAVRFCWLLAAAMVVSAAAAVGLSSAGPGWRLPMLLVVCVLAVTYSWGLKLSYRGLGGLGVFAMGLGTVVLPCAFAYGSVSAVVWVAGGLVGLWLGQIIMFSNSADAAGDADAGRMTMAARLSTSGNIIFIASVHVLGGLASAALVAAVCPGWWLLGLSPVWITQAFQLHRGLVQRDWLGARRLGFSITRLGCVVLMTLVLAGTVATP